MTVLYYHCASGISGDMNLGALIDLGVPEAHLRRELARLNLHDEFELKVERAQKMGIWGTRVRVIVHEQHPHSHGHDHHHHGRSWLDIERLIGASNYGDKVKTTVHRMFREVAEAEAHVHGLPVSDVHFHEVGATDSIVDLFGAAICLDLLGIDQVVCGPVELGSGFVRCEHGLLPVPAPATLEILRGVPCQQGGVQGEATTPTGAAILKATVQQFAPRAGFVTERIGYGVGQRDFAVPNVLRVMLGEFADEAAVPAAAAAPSNVEIKANIDDMTAEAFEPLLERLFEAGASDAFLTPIVMKKSRLAHLLTVLCTEARLDALVDVVFEHSSTIGVRLSPVGKRMLPRRIHRIATAHGEVQVKSVTLPSGECRWKLEHDDVKRLAAQHGIAYLSLRTDLEAEVGAALAKEARA